MAFLLVRLEDHRLLEVLTEDRDKEVGIRLGRDIHFNTTKFSSIIEMRWELINQGFEK